MLVQLMFHDVQRVNSLPSSLPCMNFCSVCIPHICVWGPPRCNAQSQALKDWTQRARVEVKSKSSRLKV